MAQQHLIRQRVTVRYRLTPWWLRVTVVFLVSRVVTTSLLLAFAAAQKANPWTGAHPSYIDFAKIWDGRWYEIVTLVGYPSTLPMTADGHIAENQWAFMPGYPVLIRSLEGLTGLDFGTLAVFVSLAFAFGTVLLFYKLVNRVLPSGTALFAVVLYCFAPLSPLLQVAYAESMFAFFLTLCLYLLAERRYVVLLPAIIVMAMTRPGGLAFALALAVHVVYRFVTRGRDPFPVRERVQSIVATAVAGLAGIAWIVTAWIVTGVPGAYTQTELSWRSPAYIPYQHLLPFTPWLLSAHWWWTNIAGGPLLVIIGGLVLVAFVVFLFSPWVKRLGVDIRAWVASYVLYLLAAFFPQSSTFRVLMPTFPLLGAVAQPRSRVYRVAIVLVFIALQAGWLYIAWWFDGVDWTPP